MTEKRSANIAHLFPDTSGKMGAYRFFHNDAVTVARLIESLCEPALEAASRREHVLLIQDTTSLDFSRHSGALKVRDPEIGPIGNKGECGFFVHPTLAIDAVTGAVLGVADLRLFNRSWQQPNRHERAYQSLPVAEKESFRWIEASRAVRAELGRRGFQGRATIIADREADLFELLATIPDERTELVIRVSYDRILARDGEARDGEARDGEARDGEAEQRRIFQALEQLPVAGMIEIDVPLSHRRQARRARLEVRFGAFTLCRPKNSPEAQRLAKTAPIFAVDVLEVDPPANEEPILWRLYTNRVVSTLAQAVAVVELYRQRWHVEEQFRAIKSEGLAVEESQLEDGSALKRLAVMALAATLVVLQLRQAREGKVLEPARLVFSELAVACLVDVEAQVSGKTQKLQCPFARESLAWAAWIIARLGGWDSYARGRPAGVRRLSRGLERFNLLFEGWMINRQKYIYDDALP